MATALTVQSYGARGETPSLVAADANGNTINGNDRPGLVLIARNASGGALTVRVESAAYCSHGRNSHDMDVSIPADSARHIILLGVDDVAKHRFGSLVELTYPDGVTSLTVAAARADNHYGRGTDEETPPALGSGAQTIPLTTGTDELEVIAATSAGVIMPNNGATRLVIHNTGPATRTVYAIALARCDQGFTDDAVFTVAVGELLNVPDFFPTARFGYEVGITFDAATGLEFGAVRQGTYQG